MNDKVVLPTGVSVKEKETKNKKPKKLLGKQLNVRQAQVLTYLALGKRTREIAQMLGVTDDSIRRDIRRLKETRVWDNKVDLELEKHKLLWDKSYACAEANLDAGNWQTARDILKYTGVWLDKMEIGGKIEPSDQQKRMMESVEKLLKIQAPEPRKVKQIQPHAVDPVVELDPTQQETKKIEHDPGEETTIVLQKIDLKAIIPKNCTCHWTEDGAHTIEDHCPVHGEPVQGTDGQVNPDCLCTTAHSVDETLACPVHGKKEEGGTPAPRGGKD